ncbi:AbrB family transcriptional regulator, partial [Xenorhabdus littoralis]|uniref:AbrB family transcriptional regulator n=1 Tax=Xenorhabdus littoralis TaxID=2582835 RepID=UPI0029E7DEEC
MLKNGMLALSSIVFCLFLGWGLSLFGLPLAYMFGAITAVILAYRFRIPVVIPKHSLTVVQVVLGSSIGLMVKRLQGEAVQDIFILLPAMLICLILQFATGYLWFHRKMGWSQEEAILGAIPGATAAVLALSEHIQTPPQKVVISHAIRLVLLTILAGIITGLNPPPVTASVAHPDTLNFHIFSLDTISAIGGLLLIAAGGYFLGLLLERLHFPAPYMLTSLVVAISVHYLSDVMLVMPDFLSFLAIAESQ